IDKMVRDAEAFAEEDKKRRAVAEARNQADSLVHSTERQLAEHGDKLAGDVKANIETAIADVKAVMDSGDAEAINTRVTALGQVAMKLGEAIYQAEQAAAASPAADAPKADDVVDAEFTDVDEGKK
ncbi:MAG: Hsp70 family protein, partial [Sandarakinorhabdus sp.]